MAERAAPSWSEINHVTVLNEDALLSGTLSFEISKAPKKMEIGKKGAEETPTVILSGSGVSTRHCYCEMREDNSAYLVVRDGGNATFVNGRKLAAGEEVQLNSGDRIVVGQNYVFLVVLPSGGVARDELLAHHTYESAMTELALEQGALQSSKKSQQQMEEETMHRTQYAEQLKEAQDAMEKQRQASFQPSRNEKKLPVPKRRRKTAFHLLVGCGALLPLVPFRTTNRSCKSYSRSSAMTSCRRSKKNSRPNARGSRRREGK